MEKYSDHVNISAPKMKHEALLGHHFEQGHQKCIEWYKYIFCFYTLLIEGSHDGVKKIFQRATPHYPYFGVGGGPVKYAK